jgi:hypothetical protein
VGTIRRQAKKVGSLKLLLELMIVFSVTVNQQIVWDLEIYCCYNPLPPTPWAVPQNIKRKRNKKRKRPKRKGTLSPALKKT